MYCLADLVALDNLDDLNNALASGADPNEQFDSSRMTALHTAVIMNNSKAVKLLLQHGANTHSKTYPDGLTPIDIAANFRRHDMFELLQNTT
jgi:ankyrin repeat protein